MFERESVDTKEAKGKLRSLAESLLLGGRERGCSLFLRYSRIANFGTTFRGASANVRLHKWYVEGISTYDAGPITTPYCVFDCHEFIYFSARQSQGCNQSTMPEKTLNFFGGTNSQFVFFLPL